MLFKPMRRFHDNRRLRRFVDRWSSKGAALGTALVIVCLMSNFNFPIH